MRWMVGSVVAAATMIGCTSGDTVALEHRSELTTQARGVQLSDDGNTSHVGMWGTTCEVGTRYAMMGDDFDYDSDTDTVVDIGTMAGVGLAAIVITPDMVNITMPETFPGAASVGVLGVVTARHTEAGVVAVQVPPSAGGDCAVTWLDTNGVQMSVTTPGVECGTASDMTAHANGTTWFSNASGVFRVTVDGAVTPIDSTANARLAWDASADALYVGAVGSTTLTAFEFDGAERWSTELPGTLSSLTDMGVAAGAAASVILSDGTGRFVVVDGHSGDVRADLPTPSAADALDVSGDGRVLAVTLPGAIHYFDVLTVQ